MLEAHRRACTEKYTPHTAHTRYSPSRKAPPGVHDGRRRGATRHAGTPLDMPWLWADVFPGGNCRARPRAVGTADIPYPRLQTKTGLHDHEPNCGTPLCSHVQSNTCTHPRSTATTARYSLSGLAFVSAVHTATIIATPSRRSRTPQQPWPPPTWFALSSARLPRPDPPPTTCLEPALKALFHNRPPLQVLELSISAALVPIPQ